MESHYRFKALIVFAILLFVFLAGGIVRHFLDWPMTLIPLRLFQKEYAQYKGLSQWSNTNQSIPTIAKTVGPSVVSIVSSTEVTLANPLWGRRKQTFWQQAEGSGVVVNKSGYILTNAHVVVDAKAITVVTWDSIQYTGRVIGVDTLSDLAVVKIGTNALAPIRFGDSDNLQVGQWVLAVGNPHGYQNSVTMGIVSALGRTATHDFIQTDTPINPGNSGGPLVDLNGNLVGISSAIYTKSGESMGIGFAIPANAAQKVLKDLVHYGYVRRGWLGVEIQSLENNVGEALGLDANTGAIVSRVAPGSPAAEAGIQRGDVILKIGSRTIHSPGDVYAKIAHSNPGTAIRLVVTRNGKKTIIKVKLQKRTQARVRSLLENE